jgi:hypothetical protein
MPKRKSAPEEGSAAEPALRRSGRLQKSTDSAAVSKESSQGHDESSKLSAKKAAPKREADKVAYFPCK